MKIKLAGIFNDDDQFIIDSDWIENIYTKSIWNGFENKETKKLNIIPHNDGCTIVEYKKPQDDNKIIYMYLRVKESKEEIERIINVF